MPAASSRAYVKALLTLDEVLNACAIKMQRVNILICPACPLLQTEDMYGHEQIGCCQLYRDYDKLAIANGRVLLTIYLPFYYGE